jgi:hypothetical protein
VKIKFFLIVMMLVFSTSCKKDFHESTGMIIAWEVDESSRLWIKESVTGKICMIKTGKWREPVTGLGTSVVIDVYTNFGGNLKARINADKYTYDAKKHWNDPLFPAYFTALKEHENIKR